MLITLINSDLMRICRYIMAKMQSYHCPEEIQFMCVYSERQNKTIMHAQVLQEKKVSKVNDRSFGQGSIQQTTAVRIQDLTRTLLKYSPKTEIIRLLQATVSHPCPAGDATRGDPHVGVSVGPCRGSGTGVSPGGLRGAAGHTELKHPKHEM